MYETNRLILRNWTEHDIESFVSLNADIDVMHHFPKTLSANESIALLDKFKNKINNNGFGWYAIELKITKEFVGFVGLNIPEFEADFTPCVEIGWRLHKKYWSNGLATEAAKKCLEIGFNELKFVEIVSFTAKQNKASEKVMRNIGMLKTKDFSHPKLPIEHHLSQHVLYKITKIEYLNKLENLK